MKQRGDLTDIRREYQSEPFGEDSLKGSPKLQFDSWFEHYRALEPVNATAMVLATASAQGQPAARIVLLKHYDEKGFCWYTDYSSHKGQALADNPEAELLFYWPELDRQVRISGHVEKLGRDSAEHYFNERPRGSQISAAASFQSGVVTDRAQLESQVDQLQQQYQDLSVPCPSRWGGYQLRPRRYEFWQGRESRLHDRLVYKLNSSGLWQVERLSP
ncbi:MAG: pyridoxamine 5'-phosphate oxidase [Motiliproteus sp.]